MNKDPSRICLFPRGREENRFFMLDIVKVLYDSGQREERLDRPILFLN